LEIGTPAPQPDTQTCESGQPAFDWHPGGAQSEGQAVCSPASHLLFPHAGPLPQSEGQLTGFSPESHAPFPHEQPQSTEHEVAVSPVLASHLPLPHAQSCGHLTLSSPVPQTPSPQTSLHTPQSVGQEEHDSVELQMLSPQTGAQTLQSRSQFEHVSPAFASQTLSPQIAHCEVLQSAGQEDEVSPESQTLFPQTGLQSCEHVTAFSKDSQTPFGWQSAQSLKQLLMFSPAALSHTPLPQTAAVLQSAGQFTAASALFGSQTPSPQTADAQSEGQDAGDSTAESWQTPSPQTALQSA